MWTLLMNETGEWVSLGSFETVTAAAQKIITIEDYPVSGVFFEILIETKCGNEDEAFGHLEHTAKRSKRLYTVKRVRH